MKLKLFALLGALAVSSLTMAGPGLPPPPMQKAELLFGPGWNLGAHAAYATPKDQQGSIRAWGGGIDAGYFFNQYLGLDTAATWIRPRSHTWGTYSLDLILRAPFEEAHLAPYLLAGGGFVHASGDNGSVSKGLLRAGAGLEFRATRQIGLFADWVYNWVNSGNDIIEPEYSIVRFGIKYNF